MRHATEDENHEEIGLHCRWGRRRAGGRKCHIVNCFGPGGGVVFCEGRAGSGAVDGHRGETVEVPVFRFYFDGEKTPRLTVRPRDFGNIAELPKPLADAFCAEEHKRPFRIVRSFVPMEIRLASNRRCRKGQVVVGKFRPVRKPNSLLRLNAVHSSRLRLNSRVPILRCPRTYGSPTTRRRGTRCTRMRGSAASSVEG